MLLEMTSYDGTEPSTKISNVKVGMRGFVVSKFLFQSSSTKFLFSGASGKHEQIFQI